MKKLLKPASLLFNILTLLLFFLLGLLFAGWIEAAKDQGLAGGAIVLGYGFLFGFVALLFSFFITYHVKHRAIVRANIVLAIAILLSFLFIKSNADERRKERKAFKKGTSQPTAPVNKTKVLALASFSDTSKSQMDTEMGLGVFKPKFLDKSTLFFYGQPNFEKSLSEHQPTDSIVFKRAEYGHFEIAQAPPWIVPLHLKMDYDILYFKVVSLGDEFIKIEGNKTNGHSTYLSKFDGDLLFWPEFLLQVNSVTFLHPTGQFVRIKPLENASGVSVSYDIMKPILINESWMKVALLTSDYVKKGEGWIRWKKEGKLLISYSVLS